jgi:glycosyltransferase involved in cell wall biosynthesis
MNDPLVTVLMTVYNGGHYIASTIESVLKQSYRNFEFLIVDDGSTDDSVKVASLYKDERIVVRRNEKNLGQTKSLNAGLNAARGKYVARIDADDLAFPFWLEQLVSFIEGNPEYVVVSTNAVIIDGANRIKKILVSATYPDVILRSLTASPINHIGCMMRRDVILENGGYDENFRIAADYALWSKLIRKGCKLTSLNAPLVAWRVHERSVSVSDKGERALPELSLIIRENVCNLAQWNIEESDALLIGQLLYDMSGFSRAQFSRVQTVLKDIFQNLNLSLKLKENFPAWAFQKQLLTIHVRRAFACIKENDMEAFRDTAWQYIRENGALNVFPVFLICSLFGKRVIECFPRLYEQALRISARFKLRGKNSLNLAFG